jgi:hypothetical protein
LAGHLSLADRKAIGTRLEAEYRDRFDAIGGGFSAWVNSTQIGVEALFGGRVGPVWGTSVRFGRRRFIFGPVASISTVAEAERRIRAEVENYLESKKPAQSG